MKLALGVLVLLTLIFGIYIFFPIIKSEIKYSFDQSLGIKYIPGDDETTNSFEKPLPIPDTDSSIVIPRIGIAIKVPNLPNPFEEENIKLSFGPEMNLINKLKTGDKILLYYLGRIVTYEVGSEGGLVIESTIFPEPFNKTTKVKAKLLLTNN